MATKSYPTRLIEVTKAGWGELRRSHFVFNTLLREMVEVYLDMRKGRYGETGKAIVAYLLKSKGNAHDLMNPLTDAKAKDDLETEGMRLVRVHRAKGGILFSRHKSFGEVEGKTVCAGGRGNRHKGFAEDPRKLVVGGKYWHLICNEGMSHLRSFYALLDDWKKERGEWCKKRAEFEEENPEFMRFWRGPMSDFDSYQELMRIESQKKAGQRVTERRRRKSTHGKRFFKWFLWYEWLCQHPEIVEWRGLAKRDEFAGLSEDEVDAIKKEFPRRQDRATGKMLRRLCEKNPELEALERTRKKYGETFGSFRRPPTLTFPDAEKHPRWFLLERGEHYRNVDFAGGSGELKLIGEDNNGGYYEDWKRFSLRSDRRLKPGYREEVFRREGRLPPYMEGKAGNKLIQRASSAEGRVAGLKGAKLILRGKAAHLVFTVSEQDEPAKARWKKMKGRRCAADHVFAADGSRMPVRIAAVDLGARHVGAYVIAEGVCGEAGWNIEWMKKGLVGVLEIPQLRSIIAHERELKAGRRQRGKPVKGERSFVQLQDHRTNMSDDRFKKAAHFIVELGRAHGVHVIVFESLDRLKPTAYNERWLNAQIRGMNHRNIFKKVAEQAPEFGMLTDEQNAYLTSRVCSRCGLPGARFSIKRKNPYREKRLRGDCEDYGYPVWDAGGHLFRCPHCGYRVQADINAAGNIARRFFGRQLDCRPPKKYVYTWVSDGEVMEFDACGEFGEWAEKVKQRKLMEQTPF